MDPVALDPSLESRRFLFVTGKGGVGKTTVTAAMATAFAARGKRVLIAMCNTKERLSSMFGVGPIGRDIVTVAPNIAAVNMDPEKALEEYGEIILRVRAVTHAVFDNRYTKAFFRAVPGLYEWSLLGKAWFHTTESRPEGGARFDVVLLDAPATGHGLDMLRVPKVILDVAPPGVLRRDAEAAWSLFRDPHRSGVVVVSLPEDMPTTETVELVGAVRGELGLPVLRLVVNGVLPPLFAPDERARLTRNPELLDASAPARFAGTGRGALVAGARRAAREEVQAGCLDRFERELDVPRVLLPYLFEDATSPASVRALAERF
jgi:anion-transporting  ArsA/GET3 family ATPase